MQKLLVLFLLTIFFTCEKNPANEQDVNTQEKWLLTWSDEFDGSGTPDPAKWDRPEYNRRNNDSGPDGWWLREDSYLNGKGQLVIRAKRINNKNNDGDQYDYSTGAVRSKGFFEQKFGRFEARCKLPTQPGWWVAFWLMSPTVGNVGDGGRDGTEIDIMEGFGWTEHTQHAMHWDGYGDAHQSESHGFDWPGLLAGYHTFALEWFEDEYVFYVDSVETWRTTAGGVSQVPAYVKLTGELSTENWAVSKYWSNDPTRAVWPDSFLIDYFFKSVRIYPIFLDSSLYPEILLFHAAGQTHRPYQNMD